MKEFHGNFALSQLLEFPGKRALRIAVAEKNVALQQLAREGFRFALSAKVRRAFYDLLAAQKIVGLRQNQVDSATTFMQAASKRAESGYGSDFETIKSRADLIAAQRELLESRGKVATARITLNTLLGRAPGTPLTVAGTLEGVAPRSNAAENFTALAMARNPSLRVLGLQAESAGLTLRATRFGTRPDFAVGPQLEYTRSEQIIGLGVTVQLPLWNQKLGEIATVTAEQQKILAEIEKTRLEITGAVNRSAENLRVAQEQLALYTPAFLDALRTFLSQAERSYAQNATTLIIYLDAKRTYFDAMSQYYRSLGAVAEQRAELEAAVGVPLD